MAVLGSGVLTNAYGESVRIGPPQPVHNPLTLTDENKADLKGLLATIPGFTEHMDELKEQIKHNDLKTELGHIVRRGFVKQMVVQLYNTSPLMAALIGKAKP